MRLLSFYSPFESRTTRQPRHRLGALLSTDRVLDLSSLDWLPADMLTAIETGTACWEQISDTVKETQSLEANPNRKLDFIPRIWSLEEIALCAPLPNPSSLRDFYAFEKHVTQAHGVRGKELAAEWYDFPVFYFSNHHAIYGSGSTIAYPSRTDTLDYELEIACIIGKAGMDIPPEKAVEHIFGYTILNDWTARDIQWKEVKVGLGPAKSKDFAITMGPWIATPDELDPWRTDRPGVFDLKMIARVNGVVKSQGNWKDIHYSFGEIIARASEDVTLKPGDIIASGTVGDGCLLELTRGQGPWLTPGDLVELEIEGIGTLSNKVGERKSRTQNLRDLAAESSHTIEKGGTNQ